MKPKMMSGRSMDYLFFHIFDGFEKSHEGIMNLQREKIVSDDEIAELVKKNSLRLIDRIKEFKLIERIMCIAFACLFTYMQVRSEELDMRRSSRTRTSSARSGRGARKQQTTDG